MDTIHTQFLQIQASLAEAEKLQEKAKKPQRLKKAIKEAEYKLTELRRLTEHLSYIQQVELFEKDLFDLTQKVNAKKKN